MDPRRAFGEAAGTVVRRVRAQVLVQSRPRGGHRDVPSTPATDVLWQELRDHVGSLPALERERLVRRSRREGRAVNGTHPPTHLRIALLDHRPAVPAAVSAHAAESAAIDAELAPHRTRIGRTYLAG
ncbi:hypothetical protein OH807_40295 [Kitasatospora sp. NBC_01560]|uniref:hypothetical protein n=1 Tax=Kitasatospora sp. NBC_01560 TaxID=2975965 RepID=UPI003866EEE7